MDPRALKRLSLILGVLVLVSGLFVTRRVHTDERGMELVLIALMAVGAFLTISGLIGVLTEPPRAALDEDEEVVAPALRTGRAPSLATAFGLYLLILSVIAGIVVGIATDDAGAGIQTFTFGLILGGVIYGLGVLLGYRPAEE